MKRLCRWTAAAAAVAIFAAACGGAANTATTHGSAGSLAFDYPSDWTLTPSSNIQHYYSVLAFLISPTAHASETCGPDHIAGLGSCSDSYDVPGGAAVVQLSEWDGPPRQAGARTLVADDIATGWQPLVVAGQSAAYLAVPGGASSETTLTWQIVGPEAGGWVTYEIRAMIGPGTSNLTATVEAIVASLRITPQTP